MLDLPLALHGAGPLFPGISLPASYPMWYNDPQNVNALYATPPNGPGGWSSVFRCPTNPPPTQYITACILVAYGTVGRDYPNGAPPPTPPNPHPGHVFIAGSAAPLVGRTNYLGKAGYYAPSAFPDYRGFFFHRSEGTWALGRCPDGTSNTFLFGEIVGGHIDWNGQGGLANGLSGFAWIAGFNYTGFGGPQAGPRVRGYPDWYVFSSMHAGIVQFCFGDVSVRGIRPTIDFTPYVMLSSVADGVVVNIPQ